MQIQPQNVFSVSSTSPHVGHVARVSSDTGFLMTVLTNLYQDPLRAAVREALTNAYDIHIAMGKESTPVEVFLPTQDNPMLRIRDHGCGLPETLVYDHYLVYGDSSKRQDITQTGGFGLGCKAPLAYTPMFHVISVFDGIKSHYIIAISDDGVPVCTKQYDTPNTDTQWTVGIEVGIPIKAEHVSTAIDVTLANAAWLNVAPVFHNLPQTRVGLLQEPWTYSTEHPTIGWYLNPDLSAVKAASRYLSPWDNSNAKLLIEMGGVAYPVDANALTSAAGSAWTPLFSRMASKLSGVHRAPRGAVYMAPSRESLVYNPTVVKYCQKALSDLAYAEAQALVRLLVQEQLHSPFSWRQALVQQAKPVYELLADTGYRANLDAWREFVRLVLNLWNQESPQQVATGHQGSAHTENTLGKLLTSNTFTFPRELGQYTAQAPMWLYSASMKGSGFRGKLVVQRVGVSSRGTLVDSKGKDLGPLTVQMAHPFEVVYADCSYAPSRVRTLLAANTSARVLMLTANPAIVDKKQALAALKQAAESLMAWSEMRAVPVAALSERVPGTDFVEPRAKNLSLAEKLDKIRGIKHTLLQSTPVSASELYSSFFEQNDLDEESDEDQVDTANAKPPAILLAYKSSGSNGFYRMSSEPIVQDCSNARAIFDADLRIHLATDVVIKRLLATYEVETNQQATLLVVETAAELKRLHKLLMSEKNPPFEVKEAFPTLFETYNASRRFEHVKALYPSCCPPSGQEWHLDAFYPTNVIQLCGRLSTQDQETPLAFTDPKALTLLALAKILRAAATKREKIIEVFNRIETGCKPAIETDEKNWRDIFTDVYMLRCFPPVLRASLPQADNEYTKLDLLVNQLASLQTPVFGFVSWGPVLTSLRTESAEQRDAAQALIALAVKNEVLTHPVIQNVLSSSTSESASDPDLSVESD